MCILCKLLHFIKAFKRQPDDGSVSGPKHVAVSQYNSCFERKSRFFQSVWICGLGYDPNEQEIDLISSMLKSIIFLLPLPQVAEASQPTVQ